jgi:hypothetical protein
LVGAVGIENNNVRNLKDLQGMQRNAKSLKRNDTAYTGILIAPSKLPRLSSIFEILTLKFCYSLPATNVGSGLKIRGADGEPTIRV